MTTRAITNNTLPTAQDTSPAAPLAWLQRLRQSRAQLRMLAGLPDEILVDMGLDRRSVDREVQRPFWQMPDLVGLHERRERTGSAH